MNINKLKLNKKNPQKFLDKDIEKLKNSIKDFPKMMELRPIIYDKNTMEILGGNKRFICLKELKYEDIPDNWLKSADELTDDEKKRFIIQDNLQTGIWDFDILLNGDEWDINFLDNWGLEIPDFGNYDELDKVNYSNENDEWVGMPEFDNDKSDIKLIINFESEEDRDEFISIKNIEISKKLGKTFTTWYPFKDRKDLSSLKII